MNLGIKLRWVLVGLPLSTLGATLGAGCSDTTTNNGGAAGSADAAAGSFSGGGSASGASPTAGATSAGAGAGAGGAGSVGGAMTGGASAGGISAGSGGLGGSGVAGSGGAGGGAGSGGATAGSGGAGGAAGSGGAGGASGAAGSGGAGGAGGAAGSGGAGGAAAKPFALGADISQTLEYPMMYRDVDNSSKTLLALLKNHGFNYIRLKTFVNPNAPYGYSSTANSCTGLSESFGDRDHIIAAGKQVKQAGMGFLLDFHYSDNWADPGNQIIPQDWRSAASISALAALVKSYTSDVITKAIAAGARPDMVQVGNEITNGMLKDLPGANTDCWGNNPVAAPFGGSTSAWDNLATLLKAGIQGVRDVDPTITIMLHVENTSDLTGVKTWVSSAQTRGVSFDVLGLSCYTMWQGQPSVWEATFKDLATTYPNLKFAIAEYNPERTKANTIIKALPNGRGVGTFFWEPTKGGEWGASMFTFNGDTATAIQSDFAEFDALRPQLGL